MRDVNNKMFVKLWFMFFSIFYYKYNLLLMVTKKDTGINLKFIHLIIINLVSKDCEWILLVNITWVLRRLEQGKGNGRKRMDHE